jgi:predicted O-methyltransferase YrrM
MQTAPILGQIEELVKDIPGWTPTDQLYTLFNLVYSLAGVEGDILEIGSWCGRSTVVLCLAARLTGAPAVHCVDVFPEKKDWTVTADGNHYFRVKLGGKEIEGYKGFGGVWQEPFERDIAPVYAKHDSVYEIFRETLARKSMTDLVRVYRGTSDMFAQSAPKAFRCKFAFIDGDHSYEAVCADILNVDRFLIPGGWIVFDDAFSVWEGINRAVTELVIRNPRYELAQQMARKLFVARKRADAEQ